MKIKSIHIKNVRGIQSLDINLRMIPNKPSILVAPNGSGKTSFATAFRWLNMRRIKASKEDYYNNDENNIPELIIVTEEVGVPDETYIANDTKNEIMGHFGISVISNGLKASNPSRFGGGGGNSHIEVPEIVLIDNIPDDVSLVNSFITDYSLEDAPVGMFPSLTTFLSDDSKISRLEKIPLDLTTKQIETISTFIERTKGYSGTIQNRYNTVKNNDLERLLSINKLKNLFLFVQNCFPDDHEAKVLFITIQLILLYNKNKTDFKAHVAHCKAKNEESSFRTLFESLRTTWRDIKPQRVGKQLIIKIGNTHRISNGERDILSFLAQLHKAELQLTEKINILIIDEVFDYLDDANMIAAQYYVTKLIKRISNDERLIFPIILSHLNPDYFDHHYSFKDAKVYYLKPLPNPHASDNMERLIRKRKELKDSVGKDSEENISKYMLHFNPDYSTDMSSLITGCPPEWGNISTFKSYCEQQLVEYINGNRYDTLAVCVSLREKVESYAYNLLENEEQKDAFLKQHGTLNKIKLVTDEYLIDLPEIFFLLGNLYNDPMHVVDRNQKSITQTLFSQLENQTIRNMIKHVKEM